MTEHAVAQSQAQCFVYDAATSGWKPLAEGVVNLYLYHHPVNKAYRVIGMSAQNQVVINSSLFPECKYSHSNNVFHTWTDTQFAYGIHFASEDLAKKFSADFAACIAALSKPADVAPAAPAPPAPGAAASSSSGGPPPPPPGEPPAPPAAPAAGMSLAEQIAAKKLKKAEERPPEEDKPAPVPSGGGGGNLMGELANALTRRSGTGTLKPTVKAKAPASAESEIIPLKPEPSSPSPAPSAAVAAMRSAEGPTVGTPNTMRKKVPGAGPGVPAPAPAAAAAANAVAASAGGSGLTKADLDKLKDELVKAFREELASFKTQLLKELAAQMQAAPAASDAAGYYEEEEGGN